MNDPEKTHGQRGKDLLDQVIHLTGIPGKIIHRELKSILKKKNVDLESLTIDELRRVVASYMREIMSAALDRSRENKPGN